jgi:hypothetical protein
LSRRVSLPAADDLFRPTSTADEASTGVAVGAVGAVETVDTGPAEPATEQPPSEPETAEEAARKPSGRVRHDEKMTVYVTADELMDLEHARLSLRRAHALAVDRGRMVREAVAIALADLEQNGEDSVIVRRLRES